MTTIQSGRRYCVDVIRKLVGSFTFIVKFGEKGPTKKPAILIANKLNSWLTALSVTNTFLVTTNTVYSHSTAYTYTEEKEKRNKKWL